MPYDCELPVLRVVAEPEAVRVLPVFTLAVLRVPVLRVAVALLPAVRVVVEPEAVRVVAEPEAVRAPAPRDTAVFVLP